MKEKQQIERIIKANREYIEKLEREELSIANKILEVRQSITEYENALYEMDVSKK